jgi:hypothetical protein
MYKDDILSLTRRINNEVDETEYKKKDLSSLNYEMTSEHNLSHHIFGYLACSDKTKNDSLHILFDHYIKVT